MAAKKSSPKSSKSKPAPSKSKPKVVAVKKTVRMPAMPPDLMAILGPPSRRAPGMGPGGPVGMGATRRTVPVLPAAAIAGMARRPRVPGMGPAGPVGGGLPRRTTPTLPPTAAAAATAALGRRQGTGVAPAGPVGTVRRRRRKPAGTY
jgi:hypothetical protein